MSFIHIFQFSNDYQGNIKILGKLSTKTNWPKAMADLYSLQPVDVVGIGLVPGWPRLAPQLAPRRATSCQVHTGNARKNFRMSCVMCPGSWVLGPVSGVLGPRSCVLGLVSWVLCPESPVWSTQETLVLCITAVSDIQDRSFK